MAVLHIRETQMRALREITTMCSVGGRLRRHFPDQTDSVRALGFTPEQHLAALEDHFLWTPRRRMHELRQAAMFYLAKVAEQASIVIEDETPVLPAAEAVEP